MNARDYGQHASGYRRAVVFACCIGWVMSHAGCAYPIENGLAALTGFVFVPLRLLCLVASEAGADE